MGIKIRHKSLHIPNQQHYFLYYHKPQAGSDT